MGSLLRDACVLSLDMLTDFVSRISYVACSDGFVGEIAMKCRLMCRLLYGLGIVLWVDTAFAGTLNQEGGLYPAAVVQSAAIGSASVPAFAADEWGAPQSVRLAPLALEQAAALAAQYAPQARAQHYRQVAAAADSDRAGRLPDPQLQFGTQNLDLQGSGAWNPNADAMTMRFVGISQDIPSSAVRAAERNRAQANQDAARVDTLEAQFRAKDNAASAWVDVWAAQQADRILQQLVQQNRIALDVAHARLVGAQGSATDVLAVRAARIELDNQLDAIHGEEQEADAALARWIGSNHAHAPLSDPPDFSLLPASAKHLSQNIDAQVPLLGWAPRVKVAEAALQRAKASKQPDWSVGVSYGERAPGLPALGTFQIGVRLPLFAGHREDQDINARHAELEAVQEDREDARRAQAEQLERSFALWHSLGRQVARDESVLLPLARDRSQTALAIYRGGGPLEPWLSARSAEILAQLNYVNTLAARARVWVELAYLIPEDAP